MKMVLVPGFKELFPYNKTTYDQLLADIPADTVISLLSSLNNELNTPESHSEKQARLIKLISYRFSAEQKTYLDEAYRHYRLKNPYYQNEVFARRYLLAMLMHEVSINRQGKAIHDTPQHEFKFLLAYLQMVDKVNENDLVNWIDLTEAANDPLWQYKLLWPPNINQFEFNQTDNAPFGMIKLISLCKYAYDNFKPFLKEYLSIHKFKNISQFISSFYQVTNATLNYNPDNFLKKDNRINPLVNVDLTHLKSQSINQLLGKNITIADLRKYPLYETSIGQFRVLDEGMYFQKLYKGPFFEIYQQTGLRKQKSFNEYSTDISKEVLENICFNGLCKVMHTNKHDRQHFDDNTQSQPDCYHRHNKKILFIEFKDYLFPDALISNPNFDQIKKYIDERFIKSDKGKPKGITQLLNQIRLFKDGNYQFDPSANKLLESKLPIKIYPALCYSDFMFSMPGVNQYINERFDEMIKNENFEQLEIKPITMIHIEVLFDYSYRSGNFNSLMDLIDRYWKLMKERSEKLKKDFSIYNFMRSRSSFDEAYNSIFLAEFIKQGESIKRINSLADMIGIKQQELDEFL